MSDTIFAPASGAGRAAVSVVRASGPQAGAALASLAGGLPRPRQASLRRLVAPDGTPIDHALVLWFPAPASYTGEDVFELQAHGGPAVLEALIQALAAAGLRLAEPGEFTRRAFEHGKLDLTQAEAVADLIDAETEAQRRQALDQLGGRLSAVQARWRGLLVEALAMFEAAVDFPDEELPANVEMRARPILDALGEELQAAQLDADRGERVRQGYRVALVGPPNAGKSTLLNALAGREAAIVTAIPGTTRDVIEVPMVIAGYKVLLADTAGLRATDDPVEQEGVRRARSWAETADLRLWLVGPGDRPTDAGITPRPDDLHLSTKRDLGEGMADGTGTPFSTYSPNDLAWLRHELEARVVAASSGDALPTATRMRHRRHLAEALDHLNRARAQTGAPELAAEDLRLAARALDRITGRIDPDQVLDRIFSTFCIGK